MTTIAHKFFFITEAIKNLGFHFSHAEASKLNENCFISVYRMSYINDKWIQFMTIHLLENDKIQFQAGKNHTCKYTSETINMSVIPANNETTILFYENIIKYIEHIVKFSNPDQYNTSERYYDSKPFIYKEFEIPTFDSEKLLTSKLEHTVKKGSVLIFLELSDIELNECSNEIIVFDECNFITLFMFNTLGTYEIIGKNKFNSKEGDITYIINVI